MIISDSNLRLKNNNRILNLIQNTFEKDNEFGNLNPNTRTFDYMRRISESENEGEHEGEHEGEQEGEHEGEQEGRGDEQEGGHRSESGSESEIYDYSSHQNKSYYTGPTNSTSTTDFYPKQSTVSSTAKTVICYAMVVGVALIMLSIAAVDSKKIGKKGDATKIKESLIDDESSLGSSGFDLPHTTDKSAQHH